MQHAPLPVRASRVRTRARSAAFANSKTTRRHEVCARSSAEKGAGVHLLDVTTANMRMMGPCTASPEPPKVARINGHVRSGSAGNWGAATRAANPLTAYPLSSIPGGELKASSPWADYNVGSSRLAEKNWA